MPKNTPFQQQHCPHWLSQGGKGALRCRRAGSEEALHLEHIEESQNAAQTPLGSHPMCVCVCYSLQCLCRPCQFSWRVRTPNYPSGEAEGGEAELCQALVPGATLGSNPQCLQRPCRLLWPQFHLLQSLLPPPARPQCTGRSHVLLSRAAGRGTSLIPCLSPA